MESKPDICNMTISTFTEQSRDELTPLYPSPEALTLIRYLLQERLGYSFSDIIKNGNQILDEKNKERLIKDVKRLSNGEPLQYILGFTWFSDLKIGVGPAVLIPRPETEELVQFIRDEKFNADARIVDICTGSGCIALALKQSFPELLIDGCDISIDALNQAKKNADELNLTINWLWVDVLNNRWDEIANNHYDLIVSNPPYIKESEAAIMHTNVIQFEPHLALFVPDEDPLIFYKRIAAFALKKLNPGGKLWFEINEQMGERVAFLLESLSFDDVRIYHDLSGKDRFVYAQFQVKN